MNLLYKKQGHVEIDESISIEKSDDNNQTKITISSVHILKDTQEKIVDKEASIIVDTDEIEETIDEFKDELKDDATSDGMTCMRGDLTLVFFFQEQVIKVGVEDKNNRVSYKLNKEQTTEFISHFS